MDTSKLAGRCLTLTMKGRKILTQRGILVDDITLPSCCPSCHEDFANGTEDLFDVIHNGIWYLVCCHVVNWWKDSVIKDNSVELVGAAL